MGATDLPEVVSQVARRTVRNTGREFEESFRCDADPAAAERAARAMCAAIDYVRSPSVRKVGAAEFIVRWWSAD